MISINELIKKTSIKDQVYKIIKTKILTKEFKLGEQINIARICSDLSVSNTPVREALSHLESEGLVANSANYKYKVIDLNESELIDLNQAVLTLLLGALDICINKNRVDLLVENLLEKFNAQRKLYMDNQDFDYEYINKSLDFDRQLVLVCDNKYLINVFNNLVNILLLSSIYNKSCYKEIHLDEHEKILNSIKNRDFDKTREALKEHFNKTSKSMDY